MRRTTIIVIAVAAAAVAVSVVGLKYRGGNTGPGTPPRRILLVGLDGCSFDLVSAWIREGKLPAMAAVIAEGASGSLATIRVPSTTGKRPSITSPAVWTTIATGKLPDKHGVWDFGQPLEEQAWAWMSAEAEAILPSSKKAASRVSFRVRSRGQDRVRVEITLNGRPLGRIETSASPRTATLDVPADLVVADRNVLRLRTDPGAGDASIGCAAVIAESVDGDLLGRTDPWRDPDAFPKGWELPRDPPTPIIQPAHRRVRAVWDILSDRNYSSAIIGWWGTWPAYKINGLMLSSHLGTRGQREQTSDAYAALLASTPRLTFPAEYVRHIQEAGLLPGDGEAAQLLRERIVDHSACRIDEEAGAGATVEEVIAQDLLYRNLALDVLGAQRAYALVTVYFEGTDVVGHKLYSYRSHRRETRQDWITCADPALLVTATQNYYRHVDGMLGQILARARPRYDTVMMVTDHGFDERGHADNGFIAIRGPHIRPTVIRGASVRDVTPTLLYLLGLPVARDMDGTPLIGSLRRDYVETHPVQSIPTYETNEFRLPAAFSEADKDFQERLRSLGYID